MDGGDALGAMDSSGRSQTEILCKLGFDHSLPTETMAIPRLFVYLPQGNSCYNAMAHRVVLSPRFGQPSSAAALVVLEGSAEEVVT